NKKIYVIDGRHDSPGTVFEFDIATHESRALCTLVDLAPKVPRGDVCGYDSWDNDGRFYVTSGDGVTNVALIQVDPVLVKVAYGQLPSLTEVELDPSKVNTNSFAIVRRGDLSTPCQVIYSAAAPGNAAGSKQYFSATIPIEQAALTVPFPDGVGGPGQNQVI